MFESLGSLFSKNDLKRLSDEDVRRYLEGRLRTMLGTGEVYCTTIQKQSIYIVVPSAALAAEVRMREFDIIEELKDRLHYDLKKLEIRVG